MACKRSCTLAELDKAEPTPKKPLVLHSEAIVSLSRRCDVMTEWQTKYLPAIKQGQIEWANPFNSTQRKMVSLTPFPGFFYFFLPFNILFRGQSYLFSLLEQELWPIYAFVGIQFGRPGDLAKVSFLYIVHLKKNKKKGSLRCYLTSPSTPLTQFLSQGSASSAPPLSLPLRTG